MSGNAIEEGITTTLKTPSHTDPARIAVPLGAISALLMWFALGTWLPGASTVLKFILVAGVFFALFLSVWRVLLMRALRREVAALHAARESRNQETERQIAELKKRNPDA